MPRNRHQRRLLRVALRGGLLFDDLRPVFRADLLAQTWAEAGFTYTRTGPQTGFGANGVLWTAADNVDDLDHDPVTLARKARFTWPQAANLCLHSGNLAGTGWTTNGISTGTGATAPDGVSAYTRLTVTATTNAHEIFRSLTTASGTTYTASAIVRSTGSQRWVRLTIFATALVGSAWFDLENGVWGTVSGGTTAHPVEALGNGQYRIAISATATGSGTGYWDIMASSGDGSTSSWLGTGTTYDVWAAQMEVGAVPTAYIPTTASAPTRFAPSITRATAPWFDPARGTFVCDVLNVAAVAPGTERLFWLGPGSPRLTVRRSAAQNAPTFDVNNAGGAIAAVVGNNLSANTRHAIAVAYESDYFALAQDRVIVGTDTSGTMGGSFDATLTIAGGGSGAPLAAGWRRFAYYPTALRGAALQGAAA